MDDALVEEACVVGQDLPQPLALVRLTRGLAADKVTLGRLQVLFESVNETLPATERLGCLVIVKSAWDIAGGFRTPTLKLRRNVVEATYHRHFQYCWSAARVLFWRRVTHERHLASAFGY
ncbi:hypothetical protein UMZ34_24535 [Halopseudomonas pachastrellae]|nr:hypothetical protein UMZ34_24535 [Halopseudomonas pachastrellae]